MTLERLGMLSSEEGVTTREESMEALAAIARPELSRWSGKFAWVDSIIAEQRRDE